MTLFLPYKLHSLDLLEYDHEWREGSDLIVEGRGIFEGAILAFASRYWGETLA
jgi:hypothetical protein